MLEKHYTYGTVLLFMSVVTTFLNAVLTLVIMNTEKKRETARIEEKNTLHMRKLA